MKSVSSFRLLNSEIGNDHMEDSFYDTYESMGFRLLNSEIGNDQSAITSGIRKQLMFSSP